VKDLRQTLNKGKKVEHQENFVNQKGCSKDCLDQLKNSELYLVTFSCVTFIAKQEE
jgi:hypothetical protein